MSPINAHAVPRHAQRRGLAARCTPRTWAALALLGAAALVGVSTVATKAALDTIPPLTLGFARFALGLVVLLLVCRRTGVRPAFGRTSVVLGITGVALPFACQNLGLQVTGAATATLIIEGGIPVATALLGAWLLRERLTGRRLAGLALAVAGVAAVAAHGAGANVSIVGCLLLLGTAISFSLYNVVGRRAFGGGISLPILTGSFAVGTLLLAPAAAIEIAVRGTGSISARDGLLLLYLGLGGSALTQALWVRGLVHLEAIEVAAIGALMPVAGVAAAALFLGETVTAIQAVGVPLVAAGLFLTAGSPRTMATARGRRLRPAPRLPSSHPSIFQHKRHTLARPVPLVIRTRPEGDLP